MLFSSEQFLFVFLPLVILSVWLAHKIAGAKASNVVLLIFSLIFYMWGIGATFMPILIGSIGVNFLLGLLAQRRFDAIQLNDSVAKGPNIAIIGTVVLNIGLLGYFKYANFFVAETQGLRQAFGFDPAIWNNIILPVGISFFTFQSMSYVFDIAQGKARALHNPLDFGLFVALFPQLIAGPIVRYEVIAEELRERSVTVDKARRGAIRFSHGLIKKIIIADAAGSIADTLFALPADQMTTGAAWLAAIAYTVQIYFDFSGYSDMAIGLGLMFGFNFPENFKRPYTAISITDFWRKWHITLSNWFRDYVYIPLGGSRASSQTRIYANLWVVFLLTGIWHGANWTFVIWGLYHGALLIGERITGLRSVYDPIGSNGPVQVDHYIARRAATFFLALIGWVIFRAVDVSQAFNIYGYMFSFGSFQIPPAVAVDMKTGDLAIMLIGLAIALFIPARIIGYKIYEQSYGFFVSLLLVGVGVPLAILKVISGSYSPFLYFQF